MIFTFYSFKGGVGRSMALANTAEWFYRKGLRVVIVDWDLEAPGLESFFRSSESELERVRSQIGIIDLLTEFKRQFPRRTLAFPDQARITDEAWRDSADVPTPLPAAAQLADERIQHDSRNVVDAVERLERVLPPLSTFLYPLWPPPPDAGKNAAGLWLLPAGARAGSRFEVYADLVQSFDWDEFYELYGGEAYFEWMRRQLSDAADVVLIDSRTGVTEMGGVCAQQMADVVVAFCAPNEQNQSGTKMMVEAFTRLELEALRSNTRRQKLEVLIIPSRVDRNDLNRRTAFTDSLNARFSNGVPAILRRYGVLPSNLELPYTPAYSYEEAIVIGAPGSDPELGQAYKRLGTYLAILAPETSPLRLRLTDEIRHVFPNLVPRVAVAHGDDPSAVRAATRLFALLDRVGITYWPGPITGEVDARATELITQSEHVVILLTRSVIASPWPRQLWREARQQGILPIVIDVDTGIDVDGMPPWLAREQLWKIPDGEGSDVSPERLFHALTIPGVRVRVPFMARPLPKHVVRRDMPLGALRTLLLDAVSSSTRGSRSQTLVLTGAVGAGKTVLAQAVCQDDEVVASFTGGVLWASVDDARVKSSGSVVVRELSRLYEALTGEARAFVNVDEGVKQVREQFGPGPYLLVIDGALEAVDLHPFLMLGDSVMRLVVTRNPLLVPEINIEAARLTLRETTADEAAAILTAGIPTGWVEAADPRARSIIHELANLLGRWPLALTLERSGLTSSGAEGAAVFAELVAAGVEDLRNGEPRRLDQRTVIQHLASVIEGARGTLGQDQRRRLDVLASLSERSFVTVAELAVLWGLADEQANATIVSLLRIGLLDLDPVSNNVTIPAITRIYLRARQQAAERESQPSLDVSAGEIARRRDIAQAQSVLRGADAALVDMYDLAERLRNVNEFGYARRIYGRIRGGIGFSSLSKTPARVGQRHALCTYKDPDLPAADRFKRALEILDEVDRLGPTRNEQQESAGLRGAIYKRRWQVGGQRADLERALGYYLNGYEMGPETDQGYTGINAAYVLDLLAREDARDAQKAGTRGMVANDFWARAQAIRRNLATLLPLLPAKQGEWLAHEWWFHTTRAEAHFGLAEYDEAVAALRAYNAAAGLDHAGPPLERIAPWEFESTMSQLASLGELQADLAELFSSTPGWTAPWRLTAVEMRQRTRQVLRVYLGNLALGIERDVIGKVGLALSGGGFRASLFHIGVLAHLAERDVLRRVEVLSCVSGGSIVGAHYYLEVQRLLEQKADHEITREDYVDLVQRLERAFLAGVQTNIRSRLFGSVWANLRMFFDPGYSTTQRLGDLYEAALYSQVADGRESAPRHLPDLLVRPLAEPAGFKPKYDNWRRAAKVPMLVLNATTLNTGHNWQFTASWMGEPPSTLDGEIEGNYRLRRMYYPEAPRLSDKWQTWSHRPFAPPDYQRFRLGHAVAASSCVPGLFEPLVMPDLYDGKTIRLVDGGVYDNQGVASLLEQDCTVMVVSDASGQMAAQDQPSSGRLGVPLRCFSVSMSRVRQSEFQDLDARRRSGLLKGLMFLHLKKDLDADPVDWRECQDPHEGSDEARPAARRGVLTSYGIQKSVQALLSALRTDLDSFTEVEAFALMTGGYRQAQKEFEQLDGFPGAAPPREGWRFLQIEPALHPGPGFDDLTRQLRIGQLTPGKVWMLWPPLTVVGIIILLAAAVGLVRLGWAYRSMSLVTVPSLGVFLIVLAATAIAPHLVRIIRYGHTFRDIGLRCLLAAVLAVGFKIHLALFDPIFLRIGRVARLLAMRQPRSR